ncbi:unnamed protein product, partial [Meganyctiphanes norvegica]
MNILRLAAIGPEHLGRNLSCRASNNRDIPPLQVTLQLLPVTESSLLVEMSGLPGNISAGRELPVTCTATGVRPPPTITWRLRTKLLDKHVTQESNETSTSSVVRVEATAGDDGVTLICSASAPSLPHLTVTRTANLTVLYVPEASMSVSGGVVGASGDRGFQVNGSATLTCSAKANPPAYSRTFMFNGRPLSRENLVESNSSLTLLHLTDKDAGLYTCLVANTEGDGQSNAVSLTIYHKPVCRLGSEQELLALAGQTVELVCKVRASPSSCSYTWWRLPPLSDTPMLTLPFSGAATEPPLDTQEDSGLESVTTLVANANMTRVKCLASNILGTADRPCEFTVRILEIPSAVIDCTTSDVTADSVTLSCSPGSDTGITQDFHLQVEEADGSVVYNSSRSGVAAFVIGDLSASTSYKATIWSSHVLARGPDSTITITTAGPHINVEKLSPEVFTQHPADQGSPGVEVKGTEAAAAGVGGGGGSDVSADIQGIEDPVIPLTAIAGAIVCVSVGCAVGVAVLIALRARQHSGQRGQQRGKHQQGPHGTSNDALLQLQGSYPSIQRDLSQGQFYQSVSRTPSTELLQRLSGSQMMITQLSEKDAVSMVSLPYSRASAKQTSPTAGAQTLHRRRSPRKSTSSSAGAVKILEVEDPLYVNLPVTKASHRHASHEGLQKKGTSARRDKRNKKKLRSSSSKSLTGSEGEPTVAHIEQIITREKDFNERIKTKSLDDLDQYEQESWDTIPRIRYMRRPSPLGGHASSSVVGGLTPPPSLRNLVPPSVSKEMLLTSSVGSLVAPLPGVSLSPSKSVGGLSLSTGHRSSRRPSPVGGLVHQQEIEGVMYSFDHLSTSPFPHTPPFPISPITTTIPPSSFQKEPTSPHFVTIKLFPK